MSRGWYPLVFSRRVRYPLDSKRLFVRVQQGIVLYSIQQGIQYKARCASNKTSTHSNLVPPTHSNLVPKKSTHSNLVPRGPPLGVDPILRNSVGSRSCELKKNLDKTTETELICHPPLVVPLIKHEIECDCNSSHAVTGSWLRAHIARGVVCCSALQCVAV